VTWKRTAVAVTVVAATTLPADATATAAGDLYPERSDVAAAKRWASARQGEVSFALIDSGGRLHGLDAERTYVSASVTKAMLLAAYLRRLGRAPGRSERALLTPMIVRSDNRAAREIHRRLGDGALYDLARRAGMRSFTTGVTWASARVSASDLARLFLRIDRLTPRPGRPYARRLLSSIVRRQRWGFPQPARRGGFELFFKGGWRRTPRGRLVHEAALLQRGRMRLALAVLSDGSPSHAYGAATLRGVARRLLPRVGTRALRQAGLVDVRLHAPAARLDIRYASASNFTGRRLPGYCRRWAFMRPAPAQDLGRVDRLLARQGLGLIVYDAYRPARATRAMVDWAERSGRGHLVGTYIARRSNHNAGTAVDVGLVRRHDGRPLRMGTSFDSFSPRSRTRAVGGLAGRNRRRLVRAMARHGFRNYEREWWHYDHGSSGPHLDVTLGCGP
jgi:D-alanyl-D-alanine dipeptidase